MWSQHTHDLASQHLASRLTLAAEARSERLEGELTPPPLMARVTSVLTAPPVWLP